MKFYCRALCVLLIAVSVVRAQDEDEADYGDYQPTLDDELIEYVPKYTVRLGFRGMTGVESEFSGKGTLVPQFFPYNSTTSLQINVGAKEGVDNRVYHDGYVLVDGRTTTDPAGNTHPVNDGFTNTWSFTNSEQLTEDGLVTMHTYEATLTDSDLERKKNSLASGVELTVERDFGSLFGTRIQWGIVGGMSVNQFNTIKRNTVATQLKTITDFYALGPQGAPPQSTDTVGYTGPQTNGSADITYLVGNEVLRRTETITSNSEALTSRWQSRGAYMTFRAGPTLYVPLRWGLSASFSAGAVLVYSGSNYNVTQTFKPETGDEYAPYLADDDTAFLPGYYVDANLQWAMTETAGLYMGAVYQSSGDYTQTLSTEDEKVTYRNRVDLSSLQGLRAGMSFRF